MTEVYLSQSITVDGQLKHIVQEDIFMQNIIEICKEFGIEIPDDKQADFNKKVAENYKTVSEVEKKTTKLEAERDSWKERAETAEGTLEGFEGKDFDEITRERDEWKKKAEDAEKEYSDKMAEYEKQELLKEALADVKFTSESAKKAITAQIADGVTVKNGKLIGFNDLLEEAKKEDASAFVDEEQEELEKNMARFTGPNKEIPKPGKKLTPAELMKLKNANPNLDISKYM